MTKLAEIQEAIQHLAPQDRRVLIDWLMEEETPQMLAAIDEADRSFVSEGGLSPDDVRRQLRSWLTN
jgi:hypothetical protein